jgi:hypothetical protein
MEKQEKNVTDLANKLGDKEEKEQLCFDFYHLSSCELTELINKVSHYDKNLSHFSNVNIVNINQKNIIKNKFNDKCNPIKNINTNINNDKLLEESNLSLSLSLEEEFFKQSIWTEVLESQWRLDKNNLFLNKNANIYKDLALFMKQNKLRKDDSWYLPMIYAMYEELNQKKNKINNTGNTINTISSSKEESDNSFFDDVKSYVKRKKLSQQFPIWFANIHQKDFLAFKQIQMMIKPSKDLLAHYNHSFINQEYSKSSLVECIVGLSATKHNEIKRNCFSLNTFIPAGSFYDNKYIHINTYYFEKEMVQGKTYAHYNFSRIFLHELGHAIYNDILHEKNHVLKKPYQNSFLKEHIKKLKSSYVNYRNYNFKSFYDKSAMAYYVKHKIGKRINTETKKYLFLLDRGFEESFAESFSIISYIMLYEEYKNIKNTIKILLPLLKLISQSIDWSVFGFNQTQIIRKQKIVNKFLNSK